jgi:predicted TIM-barrel fold metal-dependent hydrolase
MPGVPIIDCLFSLESVSRDHLPEPRELTREMDRAAIDRVLLAPCKNWRCERHWGPDGISLAEVNAFVTAMPHRFSGLASYNPFAIPESMALVDLAIEHGYCGVYVQTCGSDLSLSDPRMQPLYRRCQAADMPVIVQVGPAITSIASPEDLAPIAEAFPDMKIVAGISGPIHLTTILELCERNANFYFAFDGSLPFPNDNRRFRQSELAQRRAMFGSNGCRWIDLLDNIARLDMPYKSTQAFMHDNAASVMRMVVDQPVTRYA